MRDLLLELDRNTALEFCFLEKRFRRTHDEIVVSFRHRWIIAGKLDCNFTRLKARKLCAQFCPPAPKFGWISNCTISQTQSQGRSNPRVLLVCTCSPFT